MASALNRLDALLGNLEGKESEQEYSYKFSYFPVHGRGGPVRAAFYLQDIKYEDEFVNFAAFQKMQKEENYKNLEWWGLPVLTVYDKNTKEQLYRFGQSNSMLRYAATLGKFSGNSLYPTYDNLLCFRIDEICDAVEDLSNSFGTTMRLPEKEKLEKRKELWNTRWEILFEKFNGKIEFNKSLNGNKNSNYFVGNTLTIADIKFYYLLHNFASGNVDGIDKEFINQDKFKNLKSYYQSMQNVKKFQDFETFFNKRKTEWMAKQKK